MFPAARRAAKKSIRHSGFAGGSYCDCEPGSARRGDDPEGSRPAIYPGARPKR